MAWAIRAPRLGGIKGGARPDGRRPALVMGEKICSARCSPWAPEGRRIWPLALSCPQPRWSTSQVLSERAGLPAWPACSSTGCGHFGMPAYVVFGVSAAAWRAASTQTASRWSKGRREKERRKAVSEPEPWSRLVPKSILILSMEVGKMVKNQRGLEEAT